MSQTTRNILASLLVVAMAVTAFTAGYLVNDFVEQRMGLDGLVNNRPLVVDGELPIYHEAWARISDNFFGTMPDSTAIEYAAIRGSVGALDDPYTLFIEPVVRQQEIDNLRGNFGGVGATLQRNDAGEVVLSPIVGNPAAGAGILEGDVLLAVDGIALDAAMTVEAIAQQIRGEKGTIVRLTVRHPGATTPEDIDVERADILIPSVSYRILLESPEVGYIRLTRFSGESGNEVGAAIEALVAEGAERLVLDLRGNGGGLLDAAVEVSDHFLDAGPIVYQLSTSDEEEVLASTDVTVAGDIPLILLVDGGTASASEIVAGALQDYGRATLIGTRTFGKGSVQNVFDLSDGSSVHVTAARWLTPNRNLIDKQGLAPDVAIEVTQADIDNGRDPALQAAIDLFNGQLTGTSGDGS